MPPFFSIPTYFSNYFPLSQSEENILPLHSHDLPLQDMGRNSTSSREDNDTSGNSENIARSRSAGQYLRRKIFGPSNANTSTKPKVKDWNDITHLLQKHFGKKHSISEDNSNLAPYTDGAEYLNSEGENFPDPEVKTLLEMLDVKDGQRNWKKSFGKFGEACSDLVFGAGAVVLTYELVNFVIDISVSEENRTIPKAFLGTIIGVPTYQELKEFYKGTKEAFFHKEHSRYNSAEALKQFYLERLSNNLEKIKEIPEEKLVGFLTSHMNIVKNIEQAMPAKPGDRIDRAALSMAVRIMAWQLRFFINHEYEEFKEVEEWKSDDGRKTLLATQEKLLRFTPMDAKLLTICYDLGLVLRSVKVKLPKESLARAAPGVNLKDKEWDIKENWHVWEEGKIPELPKAPALVLAGLPGTGKTYFVQAILHALTKLRASMMTTPTKRKGGFEAMNAEDWPAMEQDEFVTTPKQAAGTFTLEKVKSGYGNTPAFFDEADLKDTDGLKRAADPSKKKIYSGALEAGFGFKQPLIFGVNQIDGEAAAETSLPLTYDLAGPLDDRTLLIIYRFAYAAMRRDIARETYQAFAAHLCLPIKGGDGPVLDENEHFKHQSRLQELFKSAFEDLVDMDVDAVPGARIILSTELTVEYILYRLLGEKHLGQSPMKEQEVKDFVEIYYGGKRKRNPYAKEAKEDPKMQPAWNDYLRHRAKTMAAAAKQRAALPLSVQPSSSVDSTLKNLQNRIKELEKIVLNQPLPEPDSFIINMTDLSGETLRPDTLQS